MYLTDPTNPHTDPARIAATDIDRTAALYGIPGEPNYQLITHLAYEAGEDEHGTYVTRRPGITDDDLADIIADHSRTRGCLPALVVAAAAVALIAIAVGIAILAR